MYLTNSEISTSHGNLVGRNRLSWSSSWLLRSTRERTMLLCQYK